MQLPERGSSAVCIVNGRLTIGAPLRCDCEGWTDIEVLSSSAGGLPAHDAAAVKNQEKKAKRELSSRYSLTDSVGGT